MATYADLQTRVRANVIDLPTGVVNAVPELVNKALRMLQRKHSYKVMETSAAFNTVIATRALGTMPTDFREWDPQNRPYRVGEDGAVQALDLLGSTDDALRRYSFNTATETGAPRALTWVTSDVSGAQALSVWPFPDGLSDWTAAPVGEYRITVPYFRYLPDLSADADTNWFTANADEWIENYATALAFLRNWDEQRAAVWMGLAKDKLSEVKSLDARLRVSPMRVLVPRRDVNGPRPTSMFLHR